MNATAERLPAAIGRVERLWHQMNGGQPPRWSEFEPGMLLDLDEYLLMSEIERGSSRLRYTYTGARVDAFTGINISGRYLDNIGLPDLCGWIPLLQASYSRAQQMGEASIGSYPWPSRSEDYLTIRFGVFPFVEDGEITRFIGIEDYSSFPSGLDGLVWNERQDAVAARAALDVAGSGVAWISENGEIFHLNPAMEAILVSHDGLGLEGRMLRAASRRSAEKIERAVKATAAGSRCRMLTARTSGGWYRMSFHPAPADTLVEFPCARVILVVSDHAEELNKAAAGFGEVHGLTKAELAILKALAGGENARLIAAESDRSIQTVRTQIKSILQRTGAAGQSDLIRMFAFA